MGGFLKRYFRFRLALIIIIGAILLLTFFAKQYAFFSFDLYITREIQLLPKNYFGEILIFISSMGNFIQVLVSILVACGMLAYYKRLYLAAGLFLSTTGAVFISEVLKLIVGRPRPNPELIRQFESFFRDDSFPSGHVLFAMGFYGFLLFVTYVLVQNKLWRSLISLLLVIFIILMGVSRIYKGSHWFSDTMASYLIGTVWLYVVIHVYYKLVQKKKIEPKETRVNGKLKS